MKFLKQTALLIAVIFLLFGVHHSSEWKLDTLSGVVVRANENETQQEEKEGEETSVKKKMYVRHTERARTTTISASVIVKHRSRPLIL